MGEWGTGLYNVTRNRLVTWRGRTDHGAMRRALGWPEGERVHRLYVSPHGEVTVKPRIHAFEAGRIEAADPRLRVSPWDVQAVTASAHRDTMGVDRGGTMTLAAQFRRKAEPKPNIQAVRST